MAFFDASYSANYVDRSDTLMKYFDDIKGYDILSADDERTLFFKIKNGDKTARDTVINCNQRFVVAFAKRWATKENLSDLINEGNIGLIQAIDTFDVNRGTRFLTHAVWSIRKTINEYLITNDKLVKPVNNHKVYIAAKKIKNTFYVENGRFPTSDEIKQIMLDKYNYKLSNVEDVYDIKISSLDDASANTEGDNFTNETSSEYNEVSASCNIDEYVDTDYTSKVLNQLFDTIPQKHAEIIKLLFGIDTLRPLELEEVANKVGVTRERVRQLKKEILEKLNNNLKEMKVAV